MKREMLQLSPHQYVETGRDLNGRFWIAYSSGATMFFRERNRPAAVPEVTGHHSNPRQF
jgi:hypothetical protein